MLQSVLVSSNWFSNDIWIDLFIYFKAKIECGSNEVLSDCASPCGEPSCINPTNAGVICAAVCITTCVCKPDFIRDRKGVCIPKSDCPKKKCQKNEIFSTCGNSCTEPSCDLRYTYVPCPDCQVGCYCKKGYARDNNNECIRESKCPSINFNIHQILFISI